MAEDPLERLLSLRLHAQDGRRSPHKPLLSLVALSRLHATGSSALPWSVAEDLLGGLLSEFGRPARTSPSQRAAYPFTHLRSDGVWELSADVPMDAVRPLRDGDVTGRFSSAVEQRLRDDPVALLRTARLLATAHFPESLVVDVLVATGHVPEEVLGEVAVVVPLRRRSSAWRAAVIQAWDRACAFCGYDGALGAGAVGLDAAHVRWFSYDGPDELDNGLALCALHHKLFDRGALGLDHGLRVLVSDAFTARTPASRSVYALAGTPLRPRPGAVLPHADHLDWHRSEVFQGVPLSA